MSDPCRVMRRRLTGEGMGMVRQLNRRLVPCPYCFALCRIEDFRQTSKSKKSIITIECREHGEQRILWDKVAELVQQRQEQAA